LLNETLKVGTLIFISTFVEILMYKYTIMKKILLMFVALLFAGIVNGQLRFGVKAGVNFSKFNTEEQTLKTEGAAWQIGLVSQLKIPLIGLGVQPELLYSINKGKDNSIGYFNVPINLRWQPLPIPLIKPIILVGPYFGYAVNMKGFKKENINRFDWGIGLGAGVEIWKLQIEGRYNWGLQNINSLKDAAKDFDIKNNLFTLSATYFF
jgi:hypothetical protein